MMDDGVADEEHGFDGVFETQKVIPEDISSRQAILLATWREVLSSFEDFGFEKNRNLLIIGGGPVGLSFVAIAKAFGMGKVCLSTRSDWKLAKAKSLGADAVFTADSELITRSKNYCPTGFDYVIDAVGAPSVMNQAMQAIRFDGTVGVYGTVPDDEIVLNKKPAPYNWRLIMHQWPDYSKEAAAHEPLCDYIRDGSLSSEHFITHELPFQDMHKGFEAINRNEAIKVLLHCENNSS